MMKKVYKNIWEREHEARQEQLKNIKVRDQRTRNIEAATAAVAACEARLNRLKEVDRNRGKPTWKSLEPVKSMSKIIGAAQKDVDIAKKNLAIARKTPKKPSPEKDIKDTLKRLDKFERRTGRRSKRYRALRESLLRRLEALKT